MIAQALRLDAQEQRISEFCRLDPRTLAYKDLHPPPSDHCRVSDLAWRRWVQHNEWLRETRSGDRKSDRAALDATSCDWVVLRPGADHEIDLQLDAPDPDDRVWVWWDSVAGGTLLAVDRYGNPARAVRGEDTDGEGT